MRLVALGGLLLLAGCGGGSTSGTNYSEPPPMATIVATPTPMPSASATPAATAAPDAEPADVNVAEPKERHFDTRPVTTEGNAAAL